MVVLVRSVGARTRVLVLLATLERPAPRRLAQAHLVKTVVPARSVGAPTRALVHLATLGRIAPLHRARVRHALAEVLVLLTVTRTTAPGSLPVARVLSLPRRATTH